MCWNAILKELDKIQGFNLIHGLPRKLGKNHLTQDVKYWELRWCQKTWVQDKMLPKCKLFENIPLHIQKLNYKKKIVYELKNRVEKKDIEFELVIKTQAHKKNSSYKFSQSPARKLAQL